MKTIFNKSFFVLVSALLLAGCQQDNDADYKESDELYEATATIEDLTGNELKTRLVNVGYMKYSQEWLVGDAFKAFDTDGREAIMQMSDDGKFHKVNGKMTKPTEDHIVFAYYPASLFKAHEPSYENPGRKIRVDFPGEQTYVSGKVVNTDLFPLLGFAGLDGSGDGTSSTKFRFRNMGAILCVNLKAKDDNIKVKSITLHSNEEQHLWGTMQMDVKLDSEKLEFHDFSIQGEGPEYWDLKLNCEEPVKLVKGKAVPFQFVVLPNHYENLDLSIEIDNGNGGIGNEFTYKIKSTFDIEASTANIYTKNLVVTLKGVEEGVEGEVAD